MVRRTWPLVGAIVLMVDAVQWVVVEAIAAAAWTDPPYSYAANLISDLGVPGCGAEFQGRAPCSPLHMTMNATFMLEGVLFAVGVVLLARPLTGRPRRVVIVLALLHGVGLVLVGLFHSSSGGPSAGHAVHVVGAVVGILCANIIAIVFGLTRSHGLPMVYRRLSVTVGVLGLLSEALVNLSAGTAGVFERGGVYSWLLWGVVTGVLVLARTLRPSVVGQSTPA